MKFYLKAKKTVLNLIKESYDRERFKTIGFIEPDFDIKLNTNENRVGRTPYAVF